MMKIMSAANFAGALFLITAGNLVASAPTQGEDNRCQDVTRADMYILGDASNSINGVGWGRLLNFSSYQMGVFPYGPQDTQFAWGIFSTTYQHIFNLNTYPNRQDAQQRVLSTTQLKMNTNTAGALRTIRERGYLTDPTLGRRLSVPAILLLITDGQSDNPNLTVQEATRLRMLDITIIVVGVGSVNASECKLVAGDDRNFFSIKSFGALNDIKQLLTERICQVAPTTQVPTEPTTPEPTTPEPTTPEPTTPEPTTPEPTTPEPTTPEPTTPEPTTPEPTTPEPTTPEPTTPEPTTPEPTTPEPTTPEPTTSEPTTPEPTTPEPTTPEPTTPEPTTPEPTTSEPTTPEPTTNKPTTPKPTTPEPTAYKPPKKVSTSPSPTPCAPTSKRLKLVFVIDSSGSIGVDNYKYNFHFVEGVVRSITSKAKFALITFSQTPQLISSLTDDKEAFLSILDDVPYQGRTTFTDRALQLAYSVVQSDPSEDISLIVVVTDGLSSRPENTLEASKEGKALNYNVVAVGVGKEIDQPELQAIASRPEWVLSVNSYKQLTGLITSISSIACGATLPPLPEITTEETTTSTTTTTTLTTLPPTTIPPAVSSVSPCVPIARQLKVVFVIDSSGSIGGENYRFNFRFVAGVVKGINSKAKFALITYGTHPRLISKLTDDRDAFLSILDNVPYQNSTTRTDLAIGLAVDVVQSDPSNDTVVIAVVTDGKSTKPDFTQEVIEEVKPLHYHVLSIGVGSEIDRAEIESIASRPEYVLRVTDYKSLLSIMARIAYIACAA